MAPWLVVNADDLGVSPGATLGIARAHREGVVTSASLAPTTPHYTHAVETCARECPALSLGLHFTLTSGSPVARARDVPLLAGPDGRLRWRFTSLFATAGVRRDRALLEQIGIELEAQVAKLRADGISPDHINGERHVHLIPGILECVIAAAARHDIPFVRAGRDAGTATLRLGETAGLTLNGGVVKSALLGTLSARARRLFPPGVTTPDAVASYLYTGRTDIVLPRLLRGAPLDGVTEVMTHPGLPAENGALELGNRELERYLNAADREAEMDACIEARALRHEWQLTTYRALAQAAAPRPVPA